LKINYLQNAHFQRFSAGRNLYVGTDCATDQANKTIVFFAKTEKRMKNERRKKKYMLLISKNKNIPCKVVGHFF